MPVSTGADRRVHTRIAAPVRVQLVAPDGSRVEYPCRDVSAGGAFLFAKSLPAAIGEVVRLELHVPGTTVIAPLRAELVRSVEGSSPGALLGIGVRFADPTPDERTALDAVLLRLLEGPASQRRNYPRLCDRLVLRLAEGGEQMALLKELSPELAWVWANVTLASTNEVELVLPREKQEALVVPGAFHPNADAPPPNSFSLACIQFRHSPQTQRALATFLDSLE